MYMNYLVRVTKDKKTLVAVFGNERESSIAAEALTIYYAHLNSGEKVYFHHKGLRSLLEEKVEIPKSMEWLIESDRKYQEREVANRNQNLLEPIKA